MPLLDQTFAPFMMPTSSIRKSNNITFKKGPQNEIIKQRYESNKMNAGWRERERERANPWQ